MEKQDRMDRLPPIAPAVHTADLSYPRSLVLYLQCAPHNIILTAFQGDCESRDISWCSARAQELAVAWFLQHPVARKYPPRRRMLRALLKAYITSIEEQHVADQMVSDVTAGEDPVRLELMEAYIELSISSGETTRDTDLSFKTYFNPYVGGPDSMPMYGGNPPVPAPPSSSYATVTPPLRHVTAFHSSPSQLATSPHGLKSPPLAAAEPHAPAMGAGLREHRSVSEPTNPTYRVRSLGDAEGDDEPQQPKPSASVEKLMEQFCAIRVSSEQFSNVGLSLWPAAFVLVQLLAQEFKGQTRLVADLLGLPKAAAAAAAAGSAVYTGSNNNSMPPLGAPHRLHTSPTPTPPTSPRGVGRGKQRPGMTVAPGASAAKAYSSQLRILELGAGVGLTPAFLHHMEEYRQHVATFTATDYQDAIVDNIKFNFKENGIVPVEDFEAAKRGLEGDGVPPFHCARLLDWVKHTENEGMFMQNCPDVTLAADCIYDVEVIPGLVDTIRLALTCEDISSYLTAAAATRPQPGRFDSGSSGNSSGLNTPTANAPQKQRCCIVVQTHRQNSTMQVFFSAIRKFGHVRSYTLVRQPAGTLRVSQDGSGADGGCVPLGDWDRQTAVMSPDRVVCALRPDLVLEDGSLRSAARRSGNNSLSPSSKPHALSSTESGGVAGSTHAGGGRSKAKSPSALPPRAVPATSTSGREGPLLTPHHSVRSNSSGDLHSSFSRHSSMALVEAAENLLADEMIGPFYTTMVGLIGVHIITLKPSKRMSR